MQLNADLEDLHGLLPVEVVVADEGGEASLEIPSGYYCNLIRVQSKKAPYRRVPLLNHDLLI